MFNKAGLKLATENLGPSLLRLVGKKAPQFRFLKLFETIQNKPHC